MSSAGMVASGVISVRTVAKGMAVLGVACIGFYWYPISWPGSKLVAELYVNVATSILSIAITVLLINQLYENRDLIQLKKRLTWEMGSFDQAFASRAVKELRDAGWLTDGSLRGADLTLANLKQADLAGAQLQDTNLTSANLALASLSNAILDGANLDECRADGANLKGASLKGVSLRRAKLPDAVLDDADLSGKIDLLRASLVRASLRGAKLSGARIEECDLLECDLSNANLVGATLQGANMERTSLVGADLERADLLALRNWNLIKGVSGARVAGIRNAPAGFREWAIENGAVE